MTYRYNQTVEQQMKFVHEYLSEKDRRLYAAVETEKLPHGGQSYIANLLGCARKTIRRGIEEMKNPELLPEKGRIRHKGGGRKRILDTHPELDGQFVNVLQDYTAGDPMKWRGKQPVVVKLVEEIYEKGASCQRKQ